MPACCFGQPLPTPFPVGHSLGGLDKVLAAAPALAAFGIFADIGHEWADALIINLQAVSIDKADPVTFFLALLSWLAPEIFQLIAIHAAHDDVVMDSFSISTFSDDDVLDRFLTFFLSPVLDAPDKFPDFLFSFFNGRWQVLWFICAAHMKIFAGKICFCQLPEISACIFVIEIFLRWCCDLFPLPAISFSEMIVGDLIDVHFHVVFPTVYFFLSCEFTI